MAACALSCGAAPHPRSHRHSDGSGWISALARAIRGDRARVRSVAINRETTHNATPAGDPPAIPALPPSRYHPLEWRLAAATAAAT